MSSLKPTRSLLKTPAFSTPEKTLNVQEQVQLSLYRARQIVTAYGLTEEDVKTLSPPFWGIHTDPIVGKDSGALTLMTIQLNLAAGTVASYVDRQPYLRPLLERMLRFDVTAQFCLTEVEHGLDAISIETTATLLSDGSFELHTPHPGAAKCMPPTAPCGLPCVAVVFAKLFVDDEDRGIRPFIVNLTDGIRMLPGVTARYLPQRGGARPVNHCLTYFNRLKLPSTALLGDLEVPQNLRIHFLQSIWRVAVGSLCLASVAIPYMQVAAYIAAKYSQRRTVSGLTGLPTPIFSFKTQYTPIMVALVQSFVLKEFYQVAIRIFRDETVDSRVRHGVAAAMKAISVHHSQSAHLALSDRCGAQGIFAHNQLTTQHAAMRGISIAEGDVLALSIRLASEIIVGKYEMPSSTHPTSPLALHEQGLISDAREITSCMTHHRSDDFNRLILPQCEKIVQSIGHRMAYDAAIDAGLDTRMTDLYLASMVRMDEAWYSENLKSTQRMQLEAEDRALGAALPALDEWLEMTDVADYVTAPIVSKERWSEFVNALEQAPGSDRPPSTSSDHPFFLGNIVQARL